MLNCDVSDIPQLSTPNLPAIEEYYTELTHPPRLERAGHPTRAHLHPAQPVAHSAPEVWGKPQEKEKSKGDIRIKPTSGGIRGTSDHSPVLRPPPSAERRAVDQSSGRPTRVSTAVQTDTPPPEMHECPSAQDTSKDREEQSQTYSPSPETSATITPSISSSVAQTTLPPRVHLSASTEWHGCPRSFGSTADQTSSRGVGDLTSVQRQLELDSHAAQTRASVLATLYQNYLRELKSSKPTGTPTRKIKVDGYATLLLSICVSWCGCFFAAAPKTFQVSPEAQKSYPTLQASQEAGEEASGPTSQRRQERGAAAHCH